MRVFEKFLVLIMLAGTVFWFMHFPFSSLMKFAAGTFLATLYFLFGFALLNGIPFRSIFRKSSYDGSDVDAHHDTGMDSTVLDSGSGDAHPETKQSETREKLDTSKQILPSVLGGLGLMLSVLGLMFWLLLWPGSYPLRMFGGSMLVLVGILIFSSRSETGLLWKRFVSRGLPWTLAIVVSLLLPRHTLIEIKYADDPAYLEAYKALLDNPEDEEAYERWQEEERRKYPEVYDYIE